MNPTQSFGSALFADSEALSTYWMYVVGPVIGASIGAVFYELLRGNNKEREKCAKGVGARGASSLLVIRHHFVLLYTRSTSKLPRM
jgi:hypothetical protein